METVSQQPKTTEDKIAFRAPAEWVKSVRIEVIKRETSIQDLCIAAVSQYLGMEDPKAAK